MPHALVFGSSGINGWALVNQLLTNYPSAGTSTKVTAIANREFSAEDAQWPVDERLQVVSGIDLLDSDGLEKKLRERVKGVEGVSHVYYAGMFTSFIVHSVVGTSSMSKI